MAAAAEAALNNFIVRPRAEKIYKRRVHLDDVRDEEVVSRYRLDRESILFLLNLIRPEIEKSGRENGIDAETQIKSILKTNIYTILI